MINCFAMAYKIAFLEDTYVFPRKNYFSIIHSEIIKLGVCTLITGIYPIQNHKEYLHTDFQEPIHITQNNVHSICCYLMSHLRISWIYQHQFSCIKCTFWIRYFFPFKEHNSQTINIFQQNLYFFFSRFVHYLGIY